MAESEELKSFQPSTEGGKQARKAALLYLKSITSKDIAFQELQAIGLFNEDGQKNPYFYPDPE